MAVSTKIFWDVIQWSKNLHFFKKRAVNGFQTYKHSTEEPAHRQMPDTICKSWQEL